MATLELTNEFKNQFSVGINRLNTISVREKRAVSIIKQMSGNAKLQSEKYNEVTYYKNFVKTVYEIIEENSIGGRQANE